jgi:hypothetical protein
MVGGSSVYQISDDGQIRRAVDAISGGYKAGRLVKVIQDRLGYSRATVQINGKPKRVSPHIEVLKAFVGPRPSGHDASHINGIKSDNRVENLCWETPSANHQRKLDHGTLVHGERHKCSKLKTDQVSDIRRSVAIGVKKSRMAEKYGVSKTLIGYIVKGNAWPHDGQLPEP